MPGLLSGWQRPTHQGYAAVICWEEMLEIPNSSDRAHVTWNEEGKSLPRFACVMWGLDDDSLQVLASSLKSQNEFEKYTFRMSGVGTLRATGSIHPSKSLCCFF